MEAVCKHLTVVVHDASSVTCVERFNCRLQFLDIREYHRRLLPTGIATNLLPEEEEEEEPPEGEEEPPGSNDGAETEQQDSEDMSDESEPTRFVGEPICRQQCIRHDNHTVSSLPARSTVCQKWVWPPAVVDVNGDGSADGSEWHSDE